MKLVKQETHDITLQFPCEVRFTPQGRMLCRIYGVEQDWHFYYYSDDEEVMDRLGRFEVGTILKVTGQRKERTFTRYHDQREIVITEFVISDWNQR